MAENTAIEWADHTFNPWIGCAKVSPACDGCYAEALMGTTGRMKRAEWGGPGKGVGTRVRTAEANWAEPRAWNRKAAAAGTTPFVFCASLADVFDNAVPAEWRKDLFDLIRETPNLIWLLLTKRPSNIARMSSAAGGLPSNAAIGTTVEDQARADRNVPALLSASEALWRAKTRPAFTFLSCEPMLGPIDLTSFPEYPGSEYFTDALRAQVWMKAGTNQLPGTSFVQGDRDYVGLCHGIDWVIGGLETDQGHHQARPGHPDWVRSLRDQCAAARRPFLFKQWGNWVAENQAPEATEWAETTPDHVFPDGVQVWKVGKRWTGRFLDGVLHDARPAR